MKSQNLENQKFGKLTVLRKLEKKIRNYCVWLCRCDCGNTTEAITSVLTLGRKQSCGCNLKGTGHYKWNGYKDITGYAWRRILNGAKSRKLDVNITIKDAWELFQKQNGKCALTNESIEFAKGSTPSTSYIGTASLDRIDSSKGYIKGNVQWVHKIVNEMKMDSNEKEFIEWCKKVANRHES